MGDETPGRREYTPQEREALRLPEPGARQEPALSPLEPYGERGHGGHIVRRSLAIAGRGWPSVVLLILLVDVPLQLVIAFADRSLLGRGAFGLGGGEDVPFGTPVGTTLSILDGLLVVPLLLAVVLLVFAGRARDGMEALGQARGRWLPMIGTMLAAALAGFLPLLPGGLLSWYGFVQMGSGVWSSPEASFSGPGSGAAMIGGLLFVAGVVPAIYVGLSVALAPRLAAVEGLSPVAALRASFGRMRGQRFRLFGGGLALALILGLPMAFLNGAGFAAADGLGPEGGWVLAGLVNAATGLVFYVTWAALLTVLADDSEPSPTEANP